ncbi:hypothetical protein GE09DRAFT_1246627 [Coniochaeta sp. 2T2.1]|nr:hypothetical protein GE09DRAFT_1246627 [Coniochaeta sp. 2T2.1]
MAVIQDPGLSVTVQVDCTPLEEYDDPQPDQQNPADKGAVGVCHKYVEAKDGAQYEIRLEATPDQEWISKALDEDRVLRFLVYVDGDVAEKAIKGKAISLGTSLSPPCAVHRNASAPFRYAVTKAVDKHPYAVFTFYYRSKDALQSEMIILRTPSPEPAEDELDHLSQEDIRRLARERLAEVKKEKTVKTEAPGIKREHDEVFDLTGDSPRKTRRKRAKPETVGLTDD